MEPLLTFGRLACVGAAFYKYHPVEGRGVCFSPTFFSSLPDLKVPAWFPTNTVTKTSCGLKMQEEGGVAFFVVCCSYFKLALVLPYCFLLSLMLRYAIGALLIVCPPIDLGEWPLLH